MIECGAKATAFTVFLPALAFCLQLGFLLLATEGLLARHVGNLFKTYTVCFCVLSCVCVCNMFPVSGHPHLRIHGSFRHRHNSQSERCIRNPLGPYMVHIETGIRRPKEQGRDTMIKRANRFFAGAQCWVHGIRRSDLDALCVACHENIYTRQFTTCHVVARSVGQSPRGLLRLAS